MHLLHRHPDTGCRWSYYSKHRGSTKCFSKTEVCRVRPSYQMCSQHFHSPETGRKFHGWLFPSDECLCVHALAGIAQRPANQTPRTRLNGWIKLLGPGIADCALFLLGARNSIIEAEQEEWCSQEATRSSCACQYAKVNMQPTAHYASVLAYRRWVLGLGEW